MRRSLPSEVEIGHVHVAVDAHNLARDDRGIGRYARSILSRALDRSGYRWTFVVRNIWPRPAPISRALGGARVRVTSRVPNDADVVWNPWNGTFLRSDKPSVATIHDATPFAYPAADTRRRAIEQEPFLRTAASAKRILVQSAFTAGEVERWLGVEPARIVVTPLGADAVFHREAGDTLPLELDGRRYILHVGSHDVRKNSATLAEAYTRAFPDGSVTLAYTRPPPQLPSGAIVLAAPDDAALAALYRGAALVVVPSICEGFGLPMLEALACGAPVLASRAGALPEVGGDAVAWIDDPLDIEAWSEAMRRLVNDEAERARLAVAGPARAASFSWERCTAQTLDVLREAAG